MSYRLLTYFVMILVFFYSCEEDEYQFTEPSICGLTESEELIVNELNNKFAHTFNNSDPSDVDPALDPLVEYLAEAKIVGLGEGTHGTKEFFEMKDKIFRQLALHHDFNAIIFEIPWDHALVVNNYVVNGEGNLNDAVDQTYYWVYDTQEVRNLAQWIYEINLTRTDGNKIFFVGCDPQGGDFKLAKQFVFEYLEKVAPDEALDIISLYGTLPLQLFDYDELSPEEKMTNRDRVEEVYQYMLENEERFTYNSSTYDYQVALMAAHLIKHREYIYRVQQFGVPRDSLMAVYTEWWQQIVEQDAKVAVWAHNFHVMDGKSLNGDWMGSFLRQRHQSNYRNVAFTFGTGCLNAFVSNATGGFAGPVQKQRVDRTFCPTINNTCTFVDGDQHYIIFDDLDYGSRAHKYFNSPQRVYQMGAGFNERLITRYTQMLTLDNLFDVLIHFDETNESELK